MAKEDELLDRAFQLAHFIHHDEEVAKCIALKAAEILNAALLKDDKRRYYLLRRQARSKVSFGELAKLQWLVYVESEQFEREREELIQASGQPLNQETMIIHFVKHLVRITVQNKSLYVALGISRLLHNYSTADAVELYGVVLQSPDRVPDDDYFRACKAALMRKLKKRFGGLLNVTRGVRGEERFVTHDDPSRFVALVHECLRQFTPWGTRCVVPEKFDARTGELPELRFNGNDPDEEHSVETNRFHATLEPTCFDRLMTGLGREAPERRLAIPVFALGQIEDGDDGRGLAAMSGKSPATLSHDDRRLMTQHLKRQSQRRKNSTSGILRVLVDGEECARLDAERNGHASFDVGDGAELIEIRAADAQGELLMAAHLLEYEILRNALKPQRAEYAPEGGQRFMLTITPTSEAGGNVEIRHFAPADSALAKLKSWFWPSGGENWLKPVLVYTLLLIAAGWALNRFWPSDSRRDTVVVTISPSPAMTVTPTPIEPVTPTLITPAPRLADDVLAINLKTSKDDSRRSNDTTVNPSGVASLPEVKRLAIKTNGSETANQFGQAIKNQLQGKLNVEFTDEAQKADDAAFNLMVISKGRKFEVIASINTRNGEVLWPIVPNVSGRKYIGSREGILAKLSRELLSDIQRLEKKQK